MSIATAAQIAWFQSTLPRRERRFDRECYFLFKRRFNPRSHAGSDDNCVGEYHEFCPVSIHAPTQGATTTSEQLYNAIEFQSTLPRRERPSASFVVSINCVFQSTLPRRERLLVLVHGHIIRIVSIHAPTQGATNMFDSSATESQFQSTLPRRERQPTRSKSK